MNHFMSISILIIFVLWLNYEIRKNNKLSKKGMDKFWEKEARANTARKADISELNYITIPFNKLPLDDNPDQTINSYRDTILSHSEKKILNLSGFSNTELKLKYGISNISLLSEYDNNYTSLIAILHNWGERLYQQGSYQDAMSVFETALECSTDVPKTFELLAEIYARQGSSDKIILQSEKIASSTIRDKENLLLKLQALTKLS